VQFGHESSDDGVHDAQRLSWQARTPQFARGTLSPRMRSIDVSGDINSKPPANNLNRRPKRPPGMRSKSRAQQLTSHRSVTTHAADNCPDHRRLRLIHTWHVIEFFHLRQCGIQCLKSRVSAEPFKCRPCDLRRNRCHQCVLVRGASHLPPHVVITAKPANPGVHWPYHGAWVGGKGLAAPYRVDQAMRDRQIDGKFPLLDASPGTRLKVDDMDKVTVFTPQVRGRNPSAQSSRASSFDKAVMQARVTELGTTDVA
jgi:hypothetical protein